MGSHWAEKRKARWAEILKTGKMWCRRCGELPMDKFPPKIKPAPHIYTICLDCSAADVRRNWALTGSERYRKRCASDRAFHERAKSKARRTMKGRKKTNRKKRPLRDFLRLALRRGTIVKPSKCQQCPRSEPEWRISGWFPPGRLDLSRVNWLCFPCLWETKEILKKLTGPIKEPPVITSSIDIEYEGQRSYYLERFRKFVYGSSGGTGSTSP